MRHRDITRGAAVATALFVASATVAGCDGGRGGTSHVANGTRPSASASSSASRSGTAPTAHPTSSTHSLAELTQHPCLAVSDTDGGVGKLYIAIEGVETMPKGDPKSCQWGAVGGLVSFTPYTSTDLTKDTRFRDLTHKSVSGHRARLGTYQRDGSALMVVAVGAGQSFRLIVTSFGDGAPKGPGTVGLAEEFAEAIVSHLRPPAL
ncbi:DUF3558 domain-containing protein [Actinacidiphila bryophytorum]|uniref:DUF3558 domain-containing protein n=1 Tax=Actinacidiphila bryophytorum TaxID=1436133 RepID=UPI002176EE7B|nr:DUF3558 domain-containing protein [Actinacidiphila bryophytorum]UWE10328.1 DUF3558 domain-containing protein [Actinacidiphila bryophytorum]